MSISSINLDGLMHAEEKKRLTSCWRSSRVSCGGASTAADLYGRAPAGFACNSEQKS